MFLTLFVEVFGSEYIIPKMHILVHYPRLIHLFGPYETFGVYNLNLNISILKKLPQVDNVSRILPKFYQSVIKCFSAGKC